MSDTFATDLMKFALEVTGAERGMAVDRDLNILGLANITDDDLHADDFTGFINIDKAFETGEKPYITNNVVLEPHAAPNTNTNFAKLRLVAIFPMAEYGAIYIDQHVSQGVIPEQETTRVMRMIEHLLENEQFNVTAAELDTMYNNF